MDETPAVISVHAADHLQGQILAKEKSNTGAAGSIAPPMDLKARMAMTSSCSIQGLLDPPLTAGVVRCYFGLLDADDI